MKMKFKLMITAVTMMSIMIQYKFLTLILDTYQTT